MGSNGADQEILSGGNEAECSETNVEIKIKTLDSQTYTLRVNKCMPVPALKEQIATVTGVVSEQQRLICRGKVLKDDQLLSAYHVEDGHTLHLVVRQPLPPSADNSTDYSATIPSLSTGDVRGNHAAPGVVVGTFNMADQGDGLFPDLNRIISAVISSFGTTGSGSGGVDVRQPGPERHERVFGASVTTDATLSQTEQAMTSGQSDPLHGAFQLPSAVSLGPPQSPVIPDSLTTLSQYLSRLRHDFFTATGGSQSNSAQAAGMHWNGGGESDDASRSGNVQGGLPTPASLAEVMLSTRNILVEQVGECLSQFTRQLEDQANVTDPLVRISIQSSATRSGFLLQNLGSLLLELGRTTTMLRMGRTPSEAVVSAGPAVFISRSGPNPLMVQPLPFQPGTSFGAIPTGTVNPTSGLVGGTLRSGFLPRHIDIRIRTGSSSTPNLNQGEQTDGQQPQGQAGPARSFAGANNDHQEGAGASQLPSFAGNSGVRVVPIRSVVAALPAPVGHPPSDSSGRSVGLFYPVLARVQHVASDHLNNTRGPQASSEHHSSGVESGQQPIPVSAVQQNHEGSLPTPSSTQAFNLDNNNSVNTFSSGGNQFGQESAAHISSRFDELLRATFPSDQIHVSDINIHGMATSSTAETIGPTMGGAPAATQVASPRVDEGVFLSSMLQQIMPVISQVVSTEPNVTSPERACTSEHRTAQDSSMQAEENSDSRPLHRQSDPPLSPRDSKRQKRE